MSEMTGSKIFIKCLKNEGVEKIFGYPGGAVIPIYDELYDSDIEHILSRHEQAAVHAADGYARSTGKVGVCIATSGPGATNMVTGLATAHMDSVPLVAFTGQVPTALIGSDGFQEADTKGITMPITKHNFIVTDIKDLARTIKEAFYIARTGRPGPVLVDLPKDVVTDKTHFNYPQKVELPGYTPRKPRMQKSQIERAATIINKAEKPLLYVGGGAILSGASSEIRQLVRKAQIPITTTLMALGIYPENDPLSLGMVGMHGSICANSATSEADVLIAVGARFDDRVTGQLDLFARNARIIHIDIDPAEISKIVEAHIPIVGDVKETLQELLPLIKENEHRQWQEKIEIWKESTPDNFSEESDDTIKPKYLIEEVDKLTDEDAFIVTDVGQHQMWVAQYYKFTRPGSLLTSGGLGTMGYSLPAAIGARIGNPGRQVVVFAGDGSIQMNIQELAVLRNYNIPIKLIIINNNYLGMVRQWQEFFWNKRYSATNISQPDFVKLADAYGISANMINKKQDVKKALQELFATEGPAILDVHIPEEENVLPMVPPGAGIVDMIGG